jgi:hypothetical protein
MMKRGELDPRPSTVVKLTDSFVTTVAKLLEVIWRIVLAGGPLKLAKSWRQGTSSRGCVNRRRTGNLVTTFPDV